MDDEKSCKDGSFVVVPARVGGIWLVKHGYGDRLWSLPGGGIKPGELARDAAKREAEEELQTVVDVAKFIGMFQSRKRPGTYVFLFLGEGRGNPIQKGNGGEIAECCPWEISQTVVSREVFPAQRLLVRAWNVWRMAYKPINDWLSEPVTAELGEPAAVVAARC